MSGKFRTLNTKAGKLTAEQVLELRELYASGWTQGALSRRYSMSVGQIGRIVRGESWNQFNNPADRLAMPEKSEIDAFSEKLRVSMEEEERGKKEAAPMLPGRAEAQKRMDEMLKKKVELIGPDGRTDSERQRPFDPVVDLE